MGFFDSKSTSTQSSSVDERTFNLSGQGDARNSLSSVGGVKTTGGGKKSNTTTTNNITLTDGGALDVADRAISSSFEVTDKAIQALSQASNDVLASAARTVDFAETRSASEGLDLLKSALDSAVKIALVAGGSLVAFFVLRSVLK